MFVQIIFGLCFLAIMFVLFAVWYDFFGKCPCCGSHFVSEVVRRKEWVDYEKNGEKICLFTKSKLYVCQRCEKRRIVKKSAKVIRQESGQKVA